MSEDEAIMILSKEMYKYDNEDFHEAIKVALLSLMNQKWLRQELIECDTATSSYNLFDQICRVYKYRGE